MQVIDVGASCGALVACAEESENPRDMELRDVSREQIQALCEESDAKYKLSPEGVCDISGLESFIPGDGSIKEQCEEAKAQCLSAPPEAPTYCMTVFEYRRSDCTAKFHEYEACARVILESDRGLTCDTAPKDVLSWVDAPECEAFFDKCPFSLEAWE